MLYDTFENMEIHRRNIESATKSCEKCNEAFDYAILAHEWEYNHVKYFEDERHHMHIKYRLKLGRTKETIRFEFGYHLNQHYQVKHITCTDVAYQEYTDQYCFKHKRYNDPICVFLNPAFDYTHIKQQLEAYVHPKCWEKKEQKPHYCKPPQLGFKQNREEFAYDIVVRYIKYFNLHYESEKIDGELYEYLVNDYGEPIQLEDIYKDLKKYPHMHKYIECVLPYIGKILESNLALFSDLTI